MTDPTDRTRAFQPTIPRVCPLCHGPMWQKHLEVCPGPAQRIADPPVRDEPDCDCPAGWHRSDCELVA